MVEKEDFNRVLDRIESIDERLSSIDITLAQQAKELTHHIERTNLLESQVMPIRTAQIEVLGFFKLIRFVALLAAIARGLEMFRGHFIF